MTSLLIYSFRTNKHLETFRKAGIEVFVFGKLKDDFAVFDQIIKKIRPHYIIGLAEVKTRSRSETLAINSFGNRGTIHKNGKASYALYVLPKSSFQVSKKSTNSFCNWTLYKISEIVDPLTTRVSFIHFNELDIPEMIHLCKSTAAYMKNPL